MNNSPTLHGSSLDLSGWLSRSLLVLGLTFSASLARAEEKIAIFFPSVAQPKDIQKSFEGDPSTKNFKVMAFGNFEDFQTAMTNEDVGFVVVPSSYTKYYQDVTPIYQLTSDGKTSFRFLVVSLAPEWNQDKISEGTAGVVNMIGREKTKFLVEELIENKKFKRIKQVSKISDLYPLLALGNAQYAIFSPQDLEAVKAEFTSKPIQVVKTIEISYPVIGVVKSKKPKHGEDLAKLKAATLKVLGMDGIKAVAN